MLSSPLDPLNCNTSSDSVITPSNGLIKPSDMQIPESIPIKITTLFHDAYYHYPYSFHKGKNRILLLL